MGEIVTARERRVTVSGQLDEVFQPETKRQSDQEESQAFQPVQEVPS